MHRITLVILVTFFVQAHAKNLVPNHARDMQDSLEKLVDKLIDKLLDHALKVEPIFHAGIDTTIWGNPMIPYTRYSTSPTLRPKFHRGATLGRAAQDEILSISSSPWKNLAMTAIDRVLNPTIDAEVDDKLKDELLSADDETKAKLSKMSGEVALKACDMAGVTAPLGFFDPLGFSTNVSTGRLLFYREVELKHGRIAMLASLGFLVAEQFHPLFGGNIAAPSAFSFQETPLQIFWPAVIAAIAPPEIFSIFTFNAPCMEDRRKTWISGYTEYEKITKFRAPDWWWTIRSGHVPGNLGFDPLGLKPTNPAEFKDMQNKELNNGRLAMIAAAGMVAQELATGKKLF